MSKLVIILHILCLNGPPRTKNQQLQSSTVLGKMILVFFDMPQVDLIPLLSSWGRRELLSVLECGGQVEQCVCCATAHFSINSRGHRGRRGLEETFRRAYISRRPSRNMNTKHLLLLTSCFYTTRHQTQEDGFLHVQTSDFTLRLRGSARW